MLKKIASKGVFRVLMSALMFALWADVALAAGDLASTSSDLQAQFQGMGSLAKWIIMFIGFIMVAGGIMGIANAKKTQQPLAPPILALITGLALVSITAVVDMGGNTIDSTAGGSGGTSSGLFTN